jgi:hypothetical protein
MSVQYCSHVWLKLLSPANEGNDAAEPVETTAGWRGPVAAASTSPCRGGVVKSNFLLASGQQTWQIKRLFPRRPRWAREARVL